MEEILEECKSIIDEVCEKYNYDTVDKEGNDSLRTVLLKAVPAMLVDSPEQERQIFYRMLRNTPIVVTEDLTKEKLDELKKEYLISNGPQVIDVEENNAGEYGSKMCEGGYVSDPIFDEKNNIIGKKSFIIIQKVSGKKKELLETDINISHLIHELGHAWNSEIDEYTITEDGKMQKRVGAIIAKYSYSQNNNGDILIKNEDVSGIFIEEGMNTVAEEKATANYLGISSDEMKKVYKEILGFSHYQGMIRDQAFLLLEAFPEYDLKSWRLYGNENE